MFYVRTADRLQRTSAWLDNLEGGIDYLREVVIDGQARHRRRARGARWQHVVDTYECEWKSTIEDPQKLKRFRQFVNAPGARDDNVVFVEERGQIRPARDEERATLVAKSA